MPGEAWVVLRGAGFVACPSLYAKLKAYPQIDRLKMELEWLKKIVGPA